MSMFFLLNLKYEAEVETFIYFSNLISGRYPCFQRTYDIFNLMIALNACGNLVICNWAADRKSWKCLGIQMWKYTAQTESCASRRAWNILVRNWFWENVTSECLTSGVVDIRCFSFNCRLCRLFWNIRWGVYLRTRLLKRYWKCRCFIIHLWRIRTQHHWFIYSGCCNNNLIFIFNMTWWTCSIYNNIWK